MTRKRVIKLIVLMVIMLVLFIFLNWFLIRTTTTAEMHIKYFYNEPENSMDVAIIGASEMYADYSAPLAYRDYGYTGYNYCIEGIPGQLYLPMLETYLNRQDPELVVIEVNGYLYPEEYCKREVNYRRLFDNIPFGAERNELISKYVDPDEQLSYYLPIIKHHSNWQDIGYQAYRVKFLAELEMNGTSKTKSFGTRTTVDSKKKKYKRPKEHSLNDFNKQSLDEMISFLKDRGFENVLFIRAPHKHKLEDGLSDELESIITSSGYDYLNCEDIAKDEIGIDKKTDYYNDEHLNVFGNEKFTKFLGGYIDSHYSLSKNHTEAVDKEWQECADFTAELFEKLKVKTLENEDDLYYEGNADRV